MSDNNNNTPNFNEIPDFDDLHAADIPPKGPISTSPPKLDDGLTPMPPLPDFGSTEANDIETQIPVKTSAAAAPNLNNLFVGPSSEETNPDSIPTTNPTYKVSSAEPDLANNYPLPSLDDAESDEGQEGPSAWQTTWAVVREVGETIILTLIIFFIIQLFVRNFRVVGTSMVSNLHNGQYLIIDKVSYNPYLRENVGIGGPTRGDVIVFKPPTNPDDDYVKRVIALPGEKVQVIRGQVYINDQPLPEPFEPTPGTYSMHESVIVPEGHIFVLGDNRNNSNDSHNWGTLPLENIVGRAWISYWPPELWGTIPNDTPTDEATLRYLFNQVIPTANAQNE